MNVLVSHPTLVHEQSTYMVRSGVRRVLSAATIGLLVLAPLAFGATTIAAGLTLVTASWALLLIWIFDGIRNENLEVEFHPLFLPATLLLGFTAVHWATGISVSPVETRLEWLHWVGYLTLAFVAAISFDRPQRLQRLAQVLAVCGAAIAILGIAQYLTAKGKIYWLIEPTHGGWIFGPYVNRNHFAGLMELWIPLSLGLALSPENSVVRRWMWTGLALVMSTAVVLSGSRGGVISLIAEFLFLALAAAALQGGRRAFFGLLTLLLLTGGAVVTLDRGEILERFKQTLRPNSIVQEEAAAYRLDAWRGTLEIYRQNWVIGSGLNTFADLFPSVRAFPTDKIWTHAHNDFLQFLAETGLVGAAFGIWMLVAGGREAWQNLIHTQGSATGAALIGIAAGVFGFMVHGWLDFNFHVPANAANFAVLSAVLCRRGWDEF
ncbi:MAG: O-antigen ligase family protein [Acidobacteria bacterium]|nr:O-antigen ligase family protein [Acidobacteriota bacterium]